MTNKLWELILKQERLIGRMEELQRSALRDAKSLQDIQDQSEELVHKIELEKKNAQG